MLIDNDEILRMFDDYFEHADSNLSEFFDQVALNKRFIKGDQWNPQDKAVVEGVKGKRALVINHILPIRNWMVGVQEETRTDHKVRARKGGYDAIARLYTAVLKHVYDMCDGQQVESQQFSEGLAGGSWVFIEESGDTDNGQFVIEKPDCEDVMFDPSWRTYDPNDEIHGCKYIIRRCWMDIDYLQRRYDQVRDSIPGAGSRESKPYESSIGISNFLYGKGRIREDEDPDTDRYRSDAYKFYWREAREETYVKDKRDNFEVVLGEDILEQTMYRNAASQYPQAYELKTRWVNDVHYALVWNDAILEHTVNPFGTRRYPCAAFFPFHDNKTRFGVIDNLISPQEQENKNMTNVTHLLNQTSNGGWKIKKAVSAAKKQILEMFGSRSDMVLEMDDYGGVLEKIQPNPISDGHLRLANAGSNALKEISGVNSANQGIAEDKSESGILNIQRQKQGITLNKPVFDNFNWTKRILGETLMQYIANSQVYTDEEIQELIATEELIDGTVLKAIRMQLRQQFPPPPQPDQMQILSVPEQFREQAAAEISRQYQMAMEVYEKQLDATAKPMAVQQTMEMFRKSKVWQYNVVMTDSPESVTIKLANSQIVERIAERFPGAISAEEYIKTSDLPESMKDDLIAGMKNAAMQQKTAM